MAGDVDGACAYVEAYRPQARNTEKQDATGARRHVMRWPRCARCCSTAGGHGIGNAARSSPCSPVDPALMRANLKWT